MKMPADAQAGIAAGHFDAVRRAGLPEHQAGTGEHAFLVASLDGEIRRLVHPEIVRGELDDFHWRNMLL